jgi:hypothetical protein
LELPVFAVGFLAGRDAGCCFSFLVATFLTARTREAFRGIERFPSRGATERRSWGMEAPQAARQRSKKQLAKVILGLGEVLSSDRRQVEPVTAVKAMKLDLIRLPT